MSNPCDYSQFFPIIWIAIFLSAIVLLIGCAAPAPVAERHPLIHSYSVEDPQFRRVMNSLLGPRIVTGNAVQTFVNGDEFYPAQLEAIRAAEKSINMETYMYWAGDIGRQFADALAERAKAGVAVHLVIDAIGSGKIDKEYIEIMEDAGVRVIRYNPIERLLGLSSNNELASRTHRKLLIIDGKTGFTGGAGVADVWTGNAQDPEHWRDTFFRFDGPIAAQMQAAFADNWIQSVGEVLDSDDYFPAIESAGDIAGQVFLSSPEGGSASMELMYLLAVNAAENTIDIGTPYFVPDEVLAETLTAALNRGVRIRLIVPGQHIDHTIIRITSRETWQPLLDAGMEIYEYQPTMYHTKLIVVDGLWTSVGSTNIDPFSFRLNDEANVNVFDAAFARQQTEIFENDLLVSQRVTAIEHEQRPFLERFVGFFASLWRPLLEFMSARRPGSA